MTSGKRLLLLAFAAVLWLALSLGAPQPLLAQNAQLKPGEPIAPPAAATLIVDGREAEEVWIDTGQGSFRFTAEIADEPHERSSGLMFRESMPPDHGMLFDFGGAQPVSMWMRNTPLSLDMIFIAEDGTVQRIASETTPFSEAIIASGGPVSHVLELNAGISRLIGLRPGDRVRHRSFSTTSLQ